MKPLRAALLALSLGSALAGCSDLNPFEKKQDRLPGERKSVLRGDRDLEVDAQAAAQPVRLPRPQRNPDWANPGGLPDNAMHHLALADAPREVWRTSIGSGNSSGARLTAGPVVQNGRVFAIDADSRVSALDLATGQVLWRVDALSRGDSDVVASGGVAVAGDRLFVTLGSAQIVALEAGSGREIWRQTSGTPIRGAPTVSGTHLFAITNDNLLLVMATEDGRRLWTYQSSAEGPALLSGASPAVDGNLVVAPFTNGELVGLRVDSGRSLWSDALLAIRRQDAVGALSTIAGRPVIDRGLAFAVSHGSRAAAYDTRTGVRAWELEIPGINSPWVAGDYVYILSTRGELYCVTRREGRVRWVAELPAYANPDKRRDPIVWYGPVLAGDRLIVAGAMGEAWAISPYDGRVMGRQRLPGAAAAAPVIVQETALFLLENGSIAAFR